MASHLVPLLQQEHPPNPQPGPWLIHHVWECRYAYTALNDSEATLSPHPKSYGEIISFRPDAPGWVRVALWGTEPMVVGWVPYEYIVVGKGRSDRPLRVIDHGVFDSFKATATSKFAHTNWPGTGQFDRAVSAIILGLAENIDKNGLNVSQTVRSNFAKGQQHCKNIAQKIINGTKAASQYDVLCRKTFTADEMFAAPGRKDLNTKSTKSNVAGIYFIAYENEQGKRIGYVGKSVRVVDRFKQHRRALTTESDPNYTSHHYRTARKYSKSTHAVVVCEMEINDDSAGILRIAEQVFVLLLETYRPMLVCFKVQAKSADQASAWLEDFQNANTLMAIAEKAKLRSNWPGAILSRPDEFRVQQGLNWNSPICEFMYEKNLWTRSTATYRDANGDPTKALVCSTFRLTVPRLYDKRYRRIWGISKGKTSYPGFLLHFPLESSGIPKIKDRTHVQVFAEIRQDGKKHPYCYARLPDFGCWQDWERANSIALGCEYEDLAGKWHRVYIQNTKMWRHDEINAQLTLEERQGSNTNYAEATALIRYFNNEPWVPNKMREWDFDWGHARVKDQNFSFLSQTLEFKEMPPSNLQPKNRLLEWNTIIEMMGSRKDLELKRIDGPWQTFDPSPAGFRANRRKNCDNCRLDHTRTANFKCLQVKDKDDQGQESVEDGENRCSNCFEIKGIPCSWTIQMEPSDATDKNTWKPITKKQFQALVEQPTNLHAKQISPPALSIVEVDNAEDEEKSIKMEQ